MSNLTAGKSRSDLASAYSRAVATIKNAKEQTKAITGRTVNSAITAGSGWAVGALRGSIGEGADKKIYLPGTQVEADLAIGVLATLAGVVGLADDYSEELCAFGSGALAGYAAITAYNNPPKFGDD